MIWAISKHAIITPIQTQLQNRYPISSAKLVTRKMTSNFISWFSLYFQSTIWFGKCYALKTLCCIWISETKKWWTINKYKYIHIHVYMITPNETSIFPLLFSPKTKWMISLFFLPNGCKIMGFSTLFFRLFSWANSVW